MIWRSSLSFDQGRLPCPFGVLSMTACSQRIASCSTQRTRPFMKSNMHMKTAIENTSNPT